MRTQREWWVRRRHAAWADAHTQAPSKRDWGSRGEVREMRRDPVAAALWVIALILFLMFLFGADVVNFND
jgi:hypothetical protein